MTAAARIPVFERTRMVVDRDCDILGHVNNLRWVRWVIELADAHASALGYPFETCHREGRVWVVSEQHLNYRRGAAPGEVLTEATWVSEFRGARSVRHSRWTGPDGEVCFEATTHWAFVSVERMRPTRIPRGMQDAFDILPPGGEAPGD